MNNGLQMIYIYWIVFSISTYLLCSIPFGKIISHKVADIDITQRGSGNIGATNVARELGLKWGILTLLLDVLKGFLPLYLVGLFFPDCPKGLSIVGLSALLGHQFSLFEKFRGGKGVATALGIYLAISPVSCLIGLILFVLMVSVFDFISLGSIISAAIMPLLLALSSRPMAIIIASLIMAALICLKHKDNIRRLIKGEERRWRKRVVMSDGQESGPIPHQNKNK